MKKLLLTLSPLICILFFTGCEFNECEFGDKVNVCHKGKVISVGKHGLHDHVNHGDALDMDGDGYFAGENGCSEPDCDDNNANVNPGAEDPNDCTVDPCKITNMEVLNATCTDPDPTYDLQLRVTFENAPATGTLDITIDGTLFSFAIGASPQTVNAFGLPPTGVDVNVTASFSDDATCELVVNGLYEAPDCGL